MGLIAAPLTSFRLDYKDRLHRIPLEQLQNSPPENIVPIKVKYLWCMNTVDVFIHPPKFNSNNDQKCRKHFSQSVDLLGYVTRSTG